MIKVALQVGGIASVLVICVHYSYIGFRLNNSMEDNDQEGVVTIAEVSEGAVCRAQAARDAESERLWLHDHDQ